METHRIESRCHRSGKYTVCRLVRAAFSPEIVQVGAVEGLMYFFQNRFTSCLVTRGGRVRCFGACLDGVLSLSIVLEL